MSMVVEESPGYIQVFSDGSVKRFAPEIVPASPHRSTYGFRSRDVTVDAWKAVTARLFLPDDDDDEATQFGELLPVLVYFHGGGFCIGSTAWLGYHRFLGDLSVRSRTLIVSIDYRLAPEHRLPAAYDDCYHALEWLCRGHDADPWLRLADLSRVFISGDSAGGNIVHNVAIRAIRDQLSGLRIRGLLPIHPYFGSERRTEAEMATAGPEAPEMKSNDMFWRLSLPEGSDRDYSGCNFEKYEDWKIDWGDFPATAVYVAGLDFLKERGTTYAEFLRKRGARRVELVEDEGEGHVFHVFEPEKEATRLMQENMRQFMSSCCGR